VLCAVAPTIELLVVARALQGVFGALLTPAALAVIVEVFPAEERGRAVAAWTAWGGIGTALGPLVGGQLVDAASWRWITPPSLHAPVARSTEEASVHAFHVGIGVSTVFVALGGVLGLVGIRPPPGSLRGLCGRSAGGGSQGRLSPVPRPAAPGRARGRTRLSASPRRPPQTPRQSSTLDLSPDARSGSASKSTLRTRLTSEEPGNDFR
jgi:MFS family permease